MKGINQADNIQPFNYPKKLIEGIGKKQKKKQFII
jgi:hypothetical protein